MSESVDVGFDVKAAGPAAFGALVAAAKHSVHPHLGVDLGGFAPLLEEIHGFTGLQYLLLGNPVVENDFRVAGGA